MPTSAGPETNQFRCNACGRYFNTIQELRSHEIDCRVAKESTPEGRAELAAEDATPHLPNDQESKQHPFEHCRRQSMDVSNLGVAHVPALEIGRSPDAKPSTRGAHCRHVQWIRMARIDS